MTVTNEPGAKQSTSQVSPLNAQAPKRLTNAERQKRFREKKKLTMTSEEKRILQDQKNLAKRISKGKMSEERLEELRKKDRERKQNDNVRRSDRERDNVRRSDRIRKQKAKEDMDEDQQAEYLERMRTITETHRRVERTQTSMKDGLRNKEILDGTFNVQRLEDTADSIGKMDLKCPECGAFKFKREPPGFCCSNGKVKTAPFPKPPAPLLEMWTSKDAQGNLLKKFSREINNAVALSSIKVVEKRFPAAPSSKVGF